MTSSITSILTVLFAAASLLTTSHGFSNTNIHIGRRSLYHTTTSFKSSIVSLAQQQQPNFGDWTNDDYLNNLGGGDGDENSNQYNENPAPPPAQNNNQQLSDDEITQWALNSASFYNTDVSVQEAYGVKRDGPPRREEGTEVDGW
mmetsp:Transcript_15272/g.23698  ORF Transcript_15272/g.23698 Transcript_15272/m.23698 type:complete len:145 (-) Transcript_15272:522-956(-)